MDTSRPGRRPMSVDEYLRREAASELRHEYVAGFAYAMTGGTARHATTTLNVATHLRAAARGGPCRVFANDLKVRTARDVFYYPDVLVACRPVDDDALVVGDPCLVVEVTSPSTRRTDHREKLMTYRQVPSLQAYLIVEHRRRRVTLHARGADGTWRDGLVVERGAVTLPCPATTLTLDAIYEGVTMPPLGVAEAAASRR